MFAVGLFSVAPVYSDEYSQQTVCSHHSVEVGYVYINKGIRPNSFRTDLFFILYLTIIIAQEFVLT